MVNRLKKGDLVFVPSSVTLVQFAPGERCAPLYIHRHTTTSKPSRVVLMETFDNYHKIYYNGEYWFAEQKDIYSSEEKVKLAAEQQADHAAKQAAEQTAQKAVEEKIKLIAEQKAELNCIRSGIRVRPRRRHSRRSSDSE